MNQPTAALAALIREADAQRRLGHGAEASRLARDAVVRWSRMGALEMSPPEFWWLAHQALAAGAATEEAQSAVRKGAEWLREAKKHVPEAFQDSFCHRVACHAALLSAAANMAM